MQPAAQPWIWKSVSQGAYIHGSASSAAMLHASNEGWSFLRILLSSYRKRQTNLVWTCRARSVMLQIAALTYTIHRSSRRGWIRADCYIAPFFFSRAHGNSLTVCLACFFFLFFFFFFTHSSCLSHRNTYKVACQSLRKLLLITVPGCTDTVIVRWRGGGQLTSSPVFPQRCLMF